MLRKLVTGSILLTAAVPVVIAKDAKTAKDEAATKEVTKLRPQELPIYSTIYGNEVNPKNTSESTSVVRSTIEGGVKVVRESCCDCVQVVQDKKKPVDEFVATGIEHSQFIFDYLNQPANGIHRTGAIAVGAVSGYIIAIRRGFIRRLLYTTIGGLGVASICYPKEAEQYWQQALVETKTYATILYNFAYGVKPGDEPKPLPNPIPSSFKEAYGSISKYFTSDKK